jgi:hypothetical protein
VGTHVTRALVIGAGPAGLLASRVLADRGYTVTLTTRGDQPVSPQPSWHHVHVVPEPTLAKIELLAPGTTTRWQRVSGQRRPDRAELDHALAASCLPILGGRIIAGVCTLKWGGDGAVARWDDGTRWEGEVVVDASGAARASCPSIAQVLGTPVPMDSLAGTGRYTSAVLHGVTVPSQDGFLAARGSEPGHGALLLALGAHTARITVQTPATVRITTPGELRLAWERLGNTELSGACGAAEVATVLARWGPHPTMRVVLEECAGAPHGWYPIGDALLVTPPNLGRGIAHLVEQVGLLAMLDPRAGGHAGVRAALAELSALRWMDAAIVEGLAALQ